MNKPTIRPDYEGQLRKAGVMFYDSRMDALEDLGVARLDPSLAQGIRLRPGHALWSPHHIPLLGHAFRTVAAPLPFIAMVDHRDGFFIDIRTARHQLRANLSQQQFPDRPRFLVGNFMIGTYAHRLNAHFTVVSARGEKGSACRETMRNILTTEDIVNDPFAPPAIDSMILSLKAAIRQDCKVA